MKYESELLHEILESRGHQKSSLHYQSECVEAFIEEAKGAYPKLCDYEAEWLNYIVENPTGDFPYVTFSGTEGVVENVVPYAYESAILKGSTKYRDIDTGEVLDAFEDGRNLELVSVKMPVLTTTGKNLFDLESFSNIDNWSKSTYSSFKIQLSPNTQYVLSRKDDSGYGLGMYVCLNEKIHSSANTISWITHGNMANLNPKTIQFTTNNSGIVYINAYSIETSLQKISELLKEMQIEQGTTVTAYEPFKSNILSTSEDVELRGVGDVKDTLDCLTGEVTERIGEIVLDGSEDEGWKDWWHLTNTVGCYIRFGIPNNGKAVVNNIPYNTINGGGESNDIEGYNLGTAGTLLVRILKSKLSSPDLNGFKEYLASNPIVIQYGLTQESIKTVDLTVTDQDGETLNKIKPIEGTMHITTDGEPIKPTFTAKIPVEAITQNLNSFIGE